jgi:hypothetical protein
MKVLKSGIEMDAADLKKIRGGACSCGCDIGFDSENMSDLGVDGDWCACGCEPGNPAAAHPMGISAQKYLIRP